MGPIDISDIVSGFHGFIRALQLVMYMNSVLPVDPEDEWAVVTRWDIAFAIRAATPWLDEQAMLVTIARWESVYEPRFVWCLGKSSMGAAGAFQVIPRSLEEERLLCTDQKLGARMALQRYQESRSICSHLPRAEQLAQYITGKCEEVGRRMSRSWWSSNKDLVAALSKCCVPDGPTSAD